MIITELKDALVNAAQEAGISEYELYYCEDSSATAETLKDEISGFSSGTRAGISFRCIVNEKMGYAATELLTKEEMGELVSRAIENAKNIENEDEVFIFRGSENYGTPNAKPKQAASAKELRQTALELQRRTYAASPMVTDGTQCVTLTTKSRVYLYNSYGLELSNEIGLNGAYVMPVLNNGTESVNGGDGITGLSAEEIGNLPERTVERVSTKLNAETVESGRYNIIFSRNSMSDLLGTFFPAFSAKNAQLGLSRLAGKEGERIAADCVTVTDDPMRPGYPLQTPFDGEGVAAYRKNVIENGVLQTLLYDLTTAKKAGRESTGNGLRGSYAAPVSILPYCFCIEPGTASEQQLFELAGDGIYVTELMGLHASADSVTGDFSLQSAGYRIRNGKKENFVKGFTVAGNFFEMLLGISCVADDLKFDSELPGSVTYFASPAVLVPGMSVAGE